MGPGQSGYIFDAKRNLIFSSNGGDGTISVIRSGADDKYEVAKPIRPQVSAKTIAMDPDTIASICRPQLPMRPAASRRRSGNPPLRARLVRRFRRRRVSFDLRTKVKPGESKLLPIPGAVGYFQLDQFRLDLRRPLQHDGQRDSARLPLLPQRTSSAHRRRHHGRHRARHNKLRNKQRRVVHFLGELEHDSTVAWAQGPQDVWSQYVAHDRFSHRRPEQHHLLITALQSR